LLADVGQLASTCLSELRTLCLQGAKLRACLHAETCLLRCQLGCLLLEAALRLSALAKQAANALHQLRLLRCLAGLSLLQLGHLHGGLGIKTGLLELLLRCLQAQLALLTGKLPLEACLLSSQLSGLLAKARLLSSRTCLELPGLRQLLRRLLSKPCLLSGNT
jgi:hypothetical protein